MLFECSQLLNKCSCLVNCSLINCYNCIIVRSLYCIVCSWMFKATTFIWRTPSKVSELWDLNLNFCQPLVDDMIIIIKHFHPHLFLLSLFIICAYFISSEWLFYMIFVTVFKHCIIVLICSFAGNRCLLQALNLLFGPKFAVFQVLFP